MRLWAERGRANDQQLVVKLRWKTYRIAGKLCAMTRHLALLLLVGISVSVCTVNLVYTNSSSSVLVGDNLAELCQI